MNKNSNKKINPKLKSKKDANLFNIGGVRTGSSFMSSGIPQKFDTSFNSPGGLDYSLMGEKKGLANPNVLNIDKNNLGNSSRVNAAGAAGASTASGPGVGAYIGAATGAFDIFNSSKENLSTKNIGKEVENTADISRDDIMSTNVEVDPQKTNVAGQALSGLAKGAQAGSAFGPIGMAIGAGVGYWSQGLSSLFGNKAKERAAQKAEEQWHQNIEAKDRQFNSQDTRTSMANFAANGGNLYGGGGDMPSELTEFNAGGTHEQNPNGGIMQGTGENGKPNLVEQGETKHKDYIFSDRLTIDDMLTKANGLPSILNGKTFAKASKVLNKEAKERPNDPISKNATKANMAKLTQAQESLKQSMNPQSENTDANLLAQGFACGGHVNKYDKGGFWGISDGEYTDSYKSAVNAIYNNPEMIKKISGELPQVTDRESFMKLARDKNVGDVHNWVKGVEKSTTSLPIHTVSYRSKGMSDVRVNTRQLVDLQKEQFDKRLAETNNDSTSAYYKMIDRDLISVSPVDKKGTPNELLNILKTRSSPSAKSFGVKGYSNGGDLFNGNSFAEGGEFVDFSRYAPVAANIGLGIADMFEKPEVVKYGRVSPEMITSRMDYQPIDTEWMANKMKGQSAGLRENIVNSSGGNRAIAMAGLSGINRQSQEALGEQYLKASDVNYGRKNQALQFNAGIEAQNVASRNAADAQNLQLQMQEDDMTARKRPAKRAAARNAIIQAAQGLGDIGRENWASKTGETMTGYKTSGTGNTTYKQR